ncbi:hypothetical protein C8R45DRAFT_1138163 [Mycena sanguinolenta]|nr:hypothetical protein C8R45DRAFT_1138163 [Mycena sanguinolenta]
MLVDAFPACGLGVSVATDGKLYQTEVFAASHSPSSPASLSAASSVSSLHGHGLVLTLPQRLYTSPQSVGVTGGPPFSSYHFVGVQADGLFCVDPHHSGPAVDLRRFVDRDPLSMPPQLRRPPMATHRPRPRTHTKRTVVSAWARMRRPEFGHGHGVMAEDRHHRERHLAGGATGTAEEAYYARAYTVAEMRPFHCEQVRKIPMSGLDPSMLLGFVCRDEAEWVDLRRRIKEVSTADDLAIQDEPPTSPGVDADDDDDMLQSISDPEEEVDVRVDDDEDLLHQPRPASRTLHRAHHTSPRRPSPTHTRTKAPTRQRTLRRRATAARAERAFVPLQAFLLLLSVSSLFASVTYSFIL